MNKILIIIITLFTTNLYAQDQNTEYLELKNNLLRSNNELVIELKTTCVEGEFISSEDDNDCPYESPFYLFWIKNGKYFKRKFSNCKIYLQSEIENSEFLSTIKSNLKAIENAEILPVLHSSINSNGEEEIITVEIDHYCYSNFVIHSKEHLIVKTVNEFYLNEKMIDKNTPNDNYATNQKSILKRIFELSQLEAN